MGRFSLFLGLCLIFLVIALELFWRNQWIDLYSRELKALNPAGITSEKRPRVLAMGDSFTAAQNSWVNVLRKRQPETLVVNSAVPGTSILQANVMLPGRLEALKPDLLIYQIYIGNDLFDLEYPLNWKEIGWGRNCYWWLANRLRGIGWLNYALGQWKNAAHLPDHVPEKGQDSVFVPEKYSSRELLYLKALPSLLSDQILLQGFAKEVMKDYEEALRTLLKQAEEAQVPVILAIIPHQAQMSPKSASQIAQLGATGLENPQLMHTDYPFAKALLSFAQKGKVKVLNLLPALQLEEENGNPCYYTHDSHLNDHGQEVVAREIEREMTSFGF